MSLLTEIFSFLGGGSASQSSASANNVTSVTVNPQILTVVDTAPLAQSQQALINALTGNVAPAIAGIGDAIKEAAAVEADRTQTVQDVATWVSVAGLGFALIRLVRGG